MHCHVATIDIDGFTLTHLNVLYLLCCRLCLLCLNVQAPLLRVITAVVGPRAPRLALCRGGGGLPLAIDLLPRPAPAAAHAPPPVVGQQHRGGAHHCVSASNRHSCLLSIILSPVCCPVCCSLLTVNICQLGDCVTVSEAADVLVTTVPTLRTQADFLLPDKLLPCMYYLLFLFILFIIVYL